MKAALYFDLPDDGPEFKHATKAPLYLGALRAVADALRSHRKYDAEPFTEDVFYGILRDYEIELDSE